MPAPVEFTCHRGAGLRAAVSTASAASWTVTTAAFDNTAEVARTTASTLRYGALGHPLGLPITAASDEIVAADAKPIVVADADDCVHGVDITVCADSTTIDDHRAAPPSIVVRPPVDAAENTPVPCGYWCIRPELISIWSAATRVRGCEGV